MKHIIRVKDLCKTYIVNSYTNNVLQNISFEIEKGEFVTIMGPSGSGKSTLLYTVSGLDKVTSGSVFLNEKNLSAMSEKELSAIRLNEMGFVFQQMYMMKKLCIFDNIVLPGYQAKAISREEVNAYAEELMRRLELIEIAENDITEISGGQLQRACLCRALINKPQVIFADEPTGALNSKASAGVMKELITANKNGTTVMMVTHNVKIAAQSDRVLYLVDGKINGEMKLGITEDEYELADRERKLNTWLMEHGW